jgi:hypothetical protein
MKFLIEPAYPEYLTSMVASLRRGRPGAYKIRPPELVLPRNYPQCPFTFVNNGDWPDRHVRLITG